MTSSEEPRTRTVLPAVPDSPIACSLPLAELGGRLREFERLFAGHLAAVHRAPERLDVTLRGAGLDLAAVRDLIEREHACCSFLAFELQEHGDHITLGIRGPDGLGWVLDDITHAASTAAGTHPRADRAGRRRASRAR